MRTRKNTYRYALTLPTPDRHGHRVATGTVQSSRQLSDQEVEALAKRMAHGTLDRATLSQSCSVERIES